MSPINVDAVYDNDTKRSVTSQGLVTVVRNSNQDQCFLPITIQMNFDEAVEWAANTEKAWLASGEKSWFKPLLLAHKYENATLYLIARPFTEGWRVGENECLWVIK